MVEQCTFRKHELKGVLSAVSLTLSDSTVRDSGIGIYGEHAGTLAIFNCTIADGADSGISWFWGQASASNSRITNNAGVGGIRAWASDVSLFNSIVDANRGWGIYAENITLDSSKVRNTMYRGGSVTADGCGMVIINGSGKAVVKGSEIVRNAWHGIGPYYGGGSAFVTNSTISESGGDGIEGSIVAFVDSSSIVGNGGNELQMQRE